MPTSYVGTSVELWCINIGMNFFQKITLYILLNIQLLRLRLNIPMRKFITGLYPKYNLLLYSSVPTSMGYIFFKYKMN